MKLKIKTNSIKDSKPNTLQPKEWEPNLFNKQITRLLCFFFFFCNDRHAFLGREKERGREEKTYDQS
jgi:hypothetical protein